MLIDKLCPESQDEMRAKAETCLSFMKFYENALENQPDIITDDDRGMFQLCEGFMILYALAVKGDLPKCGPIQ